MSGSGVPWVALALMLLACTRQEPVSALPILGISAGQPAPALPPHAARTSLIDPRLWTQLGPEEDPFEDRPDLVECAVDGVAPEFLTDELTYGVDTGRCNYVTARQPAQTHVTVGETVVVRLWHFALTAPNPGEAHAVVDIDGLRLLDQRVPIPAPGGLIKVAVPLQRSVAAGAPVHFHLHNHGANSWALVEVSTGP
jgi:hypothetical protein